MTDEIREELKYTETHEWLKIKGKTVSLHLNQKPLRLIDLTLRASTEEGDMVWEPFGGLCPAAISAHKLRRRSVSAEINREFFAAAAERLAAYDDCSPRSPSASRRSIGSSVGSSTSSWRRTSRVAVFISSRRGRS